MPDLRARRDYQIAEIVMAGVAMFVLKEGSRNAYNNDRSDGNFRENYQRMFGLRLPHMDTVDTVFRMLEEEHLQELRREMIRLLLKKKVLHTYKIPGLGFNVSIDATGVASYSYRHCEDCLKCTSATGKTTYFHSVLEAKLITSNGLALSMDSEWIENGQEGQYDKQDCEMKAFVRLAAKLKKHFPRLPMFITADGLYPNKTFFDICRANQWNYVVTFQDGNLSSVWEEIRLLPVHQSKQTKHVEPHKRGFTERLLKWENDICYKSHRLNYIECNEETVYTHSQATEKKRFVHLTNLEISNTSAPTISMQGRMRWKIENEGFKAQKREGFELKHKYSRVSPQAMKNYYQTLQIAHILVQLTIATQAVGEILAKPGHPSIKDIWKKLLAFMLENLIGLDERNCLQQKRRQIRLRKRMT